MLKMIDDIKDTIQRPSALEPRSMGNSAQRLLLPLPLQDGGGDESSGTAIHGGEDGRKKKHLLSFV